jgi:hypothetical protein
LRQAGRGFATIPGDIATTAGARPVRATPGALGRGAPQFAAPDGRGVG